MSSEQSKLRNRILGLFVHAGEDGRTDAELAIALQAAKNHVPCRRRDLELNGLVTKTTIRRPTDTGTFASVYRVTPKGVEVHNSPNDAPPRPRHVGDIAPSRVESLQGLLKRTRVFLAAAEPKPGALLAEIDKAIA